MLRIRYGQVNLDIFGLKDESLEDSANLPDPDVIAAEIVEDFWKLRYNSSPQSHLT